MNNNKKKVNNKMCLICCENYNNNKRKKIRCPKCNYELCLNCGENILLLQSIDYTCPECKKTWDFNFIYNNFPKSFIDNELKKNYGNICYEFDLQNNLQVYQNRIQYIFKAYNILIKVYNIYPYNYIYNFLNDYNKIFQRKYENNADNINILNLNDLLQKYNKNPNIKRFDLLDDYYKLFNLNKSFIFFLFYIKYTNEEYLNKYILDDYYIQFIQNYIKTYYKTDNKNEYVIIKNLFDVVIIDFFNQNIILENKKIKKIGKCFNNNCDGDVYKYKNQIICDTCNSIFCIKCFKQIYPKILEIYNKDKDIIEEVDNYYYLTYDKNLRKNKHNCNVDDINTVKLLTENVKNCPKCSFPIYKSDGCDHMWCPECQTMFNWSNLQITKTTTNPLYFEWVRQQGLTPARYNHPDAQPLNRCNRQLNIHECEQIINTFINFNDDFFYKISRLLELKQKPQNDGYINTYRIQYLFNIITLEQYKTFISTRYISKFFIDNYNLIVLNLIQSISEIFNNILVCGLNQETLYIPIDKYLDFKKQFKELINIYNEQVIGLNHIYPNISVIYINKNFIMENYNTKNSSNINTLTNDKNIIEKNYKSSNDENLQIKTLNDILSLNQYYNKDLKTHNKTTQQLNEFEYGSIFNIIPLNKQMDYVIYYTTLITFYMRLNKNIILKNKQLQFSVCYPNLEIINNTSLHNYIFSILYNLMDIIDKNKNIKYIEIYKKIEKFLQNLTLNTYNTSNTSTNNSSNTSTNTSTDTSINTLIGISLNISTNNNSILEIFKYLYHFVNYSYLNYINGNDKDLNEKIYSSNFIRMIIRIYDVFISNYSYFNKLFNDEKNKFIENYKLSYVYTAKPIVFSYNLNNHKENIILNIINVNPHYFTEIYNTITYFSYDLIKYCYKYHYDDFLQISKKINLDILFVELNKYKTETIFFSLSYNDYLLSFFKVLCDNFFPIIRKDIKLFNLNFII